MAAKLTNKHLHPVTVAIINIDDKRIVPVFVNVVQQIGRCAELIAEFGQNGFVGCHAGGHAQPMYREQSGRLISIS